MAVKYHLNNTCSTTGRLCAPESEEMFQILGTSKLPYRAEPIGKLQTACVKNFQLSQIFDSQVQLNVEINEESLKHIYSNIK